MSKIRIEIEILRYLSENNKSTYKAIRQHIANLTSEERKKEVAATKRGESKIQKKRELLSQEDLLVWGIIMDLIAGQILTPITHFGDMDKSQLVVSNLDKLNAILRNEEAV